MSKPSFDPAFDPTQGLNEVLARIALAEKDAERPAGSAALCAVSKVHGAERILPVLAAGQRLFGENRVQEALAKWPAMKERYPEAQVRLIGPLQTNKVKEAVGFFDGIETLDRPKLAAALAKEMEKQGRRPPVWVQVNTGEEPQKAGCLPKDAEAFVLACREDYALPVAGLMCIPPADQAPAPHFALLRKLAEATGLEALSMGMSGDFEVAVRLGATSVRVGSAIFGTRPKKD